ncbi:MAG: hypothetical protein K6B13_07785 [Prevotella sp.]|nr:hypothetical protein [Prevotella sp.]
MASIVEIREVPTFIKEVSPSPNNSFSGIRGFDALGDIVVGMEFVIPQNYVVMNRPVFRNNLPVCDHNGNQVFVQFIECKSTIGKTIEFYPASLFQVAFAVDPETGKDVTENRIHRAKGNLVDYFKSERSKGLNVDQIMSNLKGCRVKLTDLELVYVRQYDVPNEKATAADVEIKKIGTWSLVGEKRPPRWTE